MCGIVGVAGPVAGNEERIFNQLLIVDSLRGTDSTGIAVIPRDGDAKIAKEVGDPFALFDTHRYAKTMQGLHRVCIGHNRFATTGKVTARNAHPFDMNNVVGVHNGTLTSKWRLADAADFSVDSENIYHHIEKRGLEDALAYMEGAWALVWWNKNDETLNFLRNKERPLYWVQTEDTAHIYWASEEWMLTGVLGRNNIKHTAPQLFDDNVHYCIPICNRGIIGETTAVDRPSTCKPVVYSGKTYTSYTNNWTNNTAPKVDPKKELAVVQNVQQPPAVVSSPSYQGTKQVYLEILDVCKDVNGAAYFACFDRNRPSAHIRYHFHYRDIPEPTKSIGEHIICDIGDMQVALNDRTYYKVVVSTVTWEDSHIADMDSDETLYTDHTGKAVNMNAWVSAYGTCSWCGSDVLPTEKHSLTTTGECLCSSCSYDKEVLPYVELVGSLRV